MDVEEEIEVNVPRVDLPKNCNDINKNQMESSKYF